MTRPKPKNMVKYNEISGAVYVFVVESTLHAALNLPDTRLVY